MAKRFTDTDKFSDTWYRKLCLLQKVIWEYLLAECDYAGILKNFDLEMMSFKIGAEVTKKDLEIFENRIIFISDDIIFIPNFIKFQYGELNPNNKIHSSIIKELNRYNIDFHTLSKGFGTLIKGLDNSLDTLSIPLTKGIDRVKEKEKDKDKDKENNIISIEEKTKFKKPTIEEIKNYCIERKNNVDPQYFFDYYEGCNWMRGKTKIKDWQACIRTWERNSKKYNQTTEGRCNEQPYNPCI